MEDPTDVCRETDRCSSTERPEISVDLNRLLFAAKTIQEFCANRDFSLVKLSKYATITQQRGMLNENKSYHKYDRTKPI